MTFRALWEADALADAAVPLPDLIGGWHDDLTDAERAALEDEIARARAENDDEAEDERDRWLWERSHGEEG